MNILIPMAGAGSRFIRAGYKDNHKPVIPVTYRLTGEKIPMVVAATLDLPCHKTSNIIYIDRDFHKKDGVQENIKSYIPKSQFITIDYLTEGQACTCLIAKKYIDNDEELLIAGCDNGMVFDLEAFNELKKESDAIIFTYRNNSSVMKNPNDYGWVYTDEHQQAQFISVKKAISHNPTKDHAIVSCFWFKHGKNFVSCSEKMIKENDRINNEFYVDQVMQHCIEFGLKVHVFEIDKYLGWGTPEDYEDHEKTYTYWKNFIKNEGFFS